MLVFKTPENRNHVKTSLIIEFIHKLKTLKTNKKNICNSKRKLPLCINDKKMKRSTNIGVKVKDGYLPCTNINCYWIQFLTYFYAKKFGVWLLPAVTEEGHCEICRRIKNETCKFSEIKLSKNMETCINGEKI
jgi:hypothetical protein